MAMARELATAAMEERMMARQQEAEARVTEVIPQTTTWAKGQVIAASGLIRC